jgi:hypothetical protein
MNLGSILDTKISGKDLTGTLQYLKMQHAIQHDLQPQQAPSQHQYQPGPPSYINGRVKSENGSERGVSPHASDHGRYPPPSQALPPYPPMGGPMPNYAPDMRYPSPTASMGMPAPMLNGYNPNAPDHGYAQRPVDGPNGQQQQGQPGQQQGQQANGQPGPTVRMTSTENGPPKAFACSTCGKGFARRSDLARHGMLRHSRCSPFVAYMTVSQSAFTVAFAHTSAIIPIAGSSSSSDLL